MGEDAAGRDFHAFQSQILSLKERGILLALVSKNLDADVWTVIENHPGMLLRRNDFAGAQINWRPKSENLRALAKELNLGLDAFVLLDDNPVEQREVAENCPEVTVVPLPMQPECYAEMLARLWLFDGAGETGEDRSRNAFTHAELNRRNSQKSADTLQDYLTSLELKAIVRRATETDLPRVSQLLQKTNQFNLSLIRRSLPEIRALLPKHEILIIEARDRFGDYGLVGVCIHRREQDSIFLDSLLVSCRALGRGIEEVFLAAIVKQALAIDAKFLLARFVEGARNEPMRKFLDKSSFVQTTAGEYMLELHRPPSAPAHIDFKIAS